MENSQRDMFEDSSEVIQPQPSASNDESEKSLDNSESSANNSQSSVDDIIESSQDVTMKSETPRRRSRRTAVTQQEETLQKTERDIEAELLAAVQTGDVDIVEKLFSDQKKAAKLPLHEAAVSDKTEAVRILELLLSQGALLDARSSEGDTALHSALRQGRTGQVRALLRAGADVGETFY